MRTDPNLRDRANCSALPCAATLREFGALLDPRAKELRATEAFLREVMPEKATRDAALRYLAAQGLVRPGDGPSKWLRQVRYADGRVRVVCFDPGLLTCPMAGDSAGNAA